MLRNTAGFLSMGAYTPLSSLWPHQRWHPGFRHGVPVASPELQSAQSTPLIATAPPYQPPFGPLEAPNQALNAIFSSLCLQRSLWPTLSNPSCLNSITAVSETQYLKYSNARINEMAEIMVAADFLLWLQVSLILKRACRVEPDLRVHAHFCS